ncbi:mucin desulfatase [Clostridia bacterium]|nr:mucin desulfatase [Clostridia bacterium]
MEMIEQAYEFKLDGEPQDCKPLGNGHINNTFLITDDTGKRYTLQRINKTVFRNPQAVLLNVMGVTGHLRGKGVSPVLTLVPAKTGIHWHIDESGDYWRVYHFIENSVCLEKAESLNDFRECASAFGKFQKALADFNAGGLCETIERFHDTPNRYAQLREAVAAFPGCARKISHELTFALKREKYAGTLAKRLERGELPLRVTHNDAKLNNVLFDQTTRKAACVIDLDTVMPGLTAYDFGDAIRFGASTGAEDEPDLSKVGLSLPLFEAFAEGFLGECGGSLTKNEINSLVDGAIVITLEQGARFLTDFLNGDVYYHTTRERQNLDRARAQFKLAESMEKHRAEMDAVIRKYA